MSPSRPVTDKQYLLELSYDGAPFFGFQSQPEGNTVQDCIEAALATFLRHPVRIVGSSRTDSGVHAHQQFAVFRTAVVFDPVKLVLALHALMPATIAVRAISEVPESFHPIRSATAKLYRYKLWTSPFRDADSFRRCWWVKKPLAMPVLWRESGALIGRHDFASFCAADSSAKTTVRQLYDIRIRQKGHLIEVWVLGEGFLKQMVRAVVGTLVQHGCSGSSYGLSQASLPPMAAILASKDRKAAGMTAPAHGLCLERVFFSPTRLITDDMLA